ncbi:MAG: glutamine--fructose-6-phosphate transaminase (isomerizing) [Acidimicrobiales bacterium]
MCGIIAATGGDEVLDVILDGLARLEYRGYDSAGLALTTVCDDATVVDGDLEGAAPVTLWRARAADGTRSLDHLAKQAEGASAPVRAGIGHTRWATHGRPSEGNAHPHLDCTGRIAVVHNGIIENHTELAAELSSAGHRLRSETDTEVIVHLVEAALAGGAPGLAAAVRAALARVRGAFALAVLAADEPDLVVAARRVSPLVVGVTSSSAFLASDIPALLGRTDRFYVLDDDQLAELRPGSLVVTTLEGDPVEPVATTVEWDLDAARKDGFDDFMSKEIHEQPTAVANTLLDRVHADGRLVLDELRVGRDVLAGIDKVFVVACGSSYHAGLMAKYAIEHWARLPVEIDIASEFRYRDPVVDEGTLVVGVSQSGETVDTLQALREAKRKGARVLVVCNVVDASMTREADAVLYTRAGPEIGVAATKTHLAQITALLLLALTLAQVRGTLEDADVRLLLGDLHALPDKVGLAVDRGDDVRAVAEQVRDASAFLFLGRHVGYPVALEGALKLKELSYLRAEGFPAGELKHGPIALVEPGTVVLGVATRTGLWEKMMANVAEVRSRGATVVLVANDGDEETAGLADAVLWVPATHPLLSPVVDVVPFQLFAYALARLHGYDVDRPRNLAKVVTVE